MPQQTATLMEGHRDQQDGQNYLLSALVPESLYEQVERLCEADDVDVDTFVTSAISGTLEGRLATL